MQHFLTFQLYLCLQTVSAFAFSLEESNRFLLSLLEEYGHGWTCFSL